MRKNETNDCVICKEVKPIEKFLKGKKNIDPLYCSDCRPRSNTREYHQKWNSNRYKTDEMFNLGKRLRARMFKVLDKANINKNENSLDILGCSLEELKKHLEEQFTDGMSWDNRSEWHIDHIVPLSSANNKEELYQLFHYKNLQPLWAKDNLIKGKKLLKNF